MSAFFYRSAPACAYLSTADETNLLLVFPATFAEADSPWVSHRRQSITAAHAVLAVMLPSMQLSFLFDCDDVALPALKLDPDTELARVVSADVEVRQRAVLHDVECSCDDRF